MKSPLAALSALALLSTGCQPPTVPAPSSFSYRIDLTIGEQQDGGTSVASYYLEGDKRHRVKYEQESLIIELSPWTRSLDTLRLWKDFGVSSVSVPASDFAGNFRIARLSTANLDLSQLPTYAARRGLQGAHVFSSAEAAKTFMVALALQEAKDSLGIRHASPNHYNDLTSVP